MIYQIKSQENESWIDVPKNLFKSEAKFRGRRQVIDLSDIEMLHQEAISKFYRSDDSKKEYWQGAIDILNEILTAECSHLRQVATVKTEGE